ncbi:MAG: HDIG domain-containing protein [Phycisphaeraceae bacterium]|nr:HDIG domain-containing protein [Phycisphaeraceae bacterium]
MARTQAGKTATARSDRRRADIRRTLPRPSQGVLLFLQQPEVLSALLLTTAFVLLTGLLVVWSRDNSSPAMGQIMTEPRFKRVSYAVIDQAGTQAARDEARRNAPRVYRLASAPLERLRAGLVGLPTALAGKTGVADISPDIVEEFRLTDSAVRLLAQYAQEGAPDQRWSRWVDRLIQDLEQSPILGSLEYQVYTRTLRKAVLPAENQSLVPLTKPAIELLPGDRESLERHLEPYVVRAGFAGAIVPHVVAGLVHRPAETMVYDAALTEAEAVRAAGLVQPILIEHRAGDPVYRRGDRLSAAQVHDLLLEREQFLLHSTLADRWVPRIGLLGLIAILVGFVGGFVVMSYPRIIRNPVRLIALFSLQAAMLAATAATSIAIPQLSTAAAIGPTLFVTIITLLAYDRRLSLFVSTVQCALVALALDRGLGWFTMLIAGCGAMILQLTELRQRNALIRASLATGVVLAFGSAVLGMFRIPLVEGIVAQITSQAVLAFLSSMLLGFLVLGILPSIERVFDITTGMTLAELRDPRRPLLRQLQTRAPGTYNHSLMVAAVAEAAADAIRADSLLLYVGALYHDIGKMNKPEYFVENQSEGINRHNKLRPAMSLLVIIGHVKDGIELAREYGLPRSIQHFIESHHGTTLVEYFYHAAREQAEAEQKMSVGEMEYRYPGPKPRTREAAILMLADAVESATRAVQDPGPARIENIVRELSRKRLLDDQFSECDLTLRELRQIEDAMIQRLVSIHHGRIQYPRGSRADDAETGTGTAVIEPPSELRRTRA